MNPVIINLATGRYLKGQERLKQSVQRYSPKIPVMSWQNEFQISGCPKHSVNPYAFKVYAFYKAIALGYDTILWMDASCYLIKDISPIFDVIDKEGYIMQEAGHYAGRWCNDNCLNYFGITREEANSLLMYGNAGFLGLSGYSQTAVTFLDEWRKSMEAGAFKGDWSNHRHDMVCGSIIANQLGMEYKKGDEYLAYASPEENVSDKIYIKAQGIH